jgi:hypothetical protein
MMTTNKGCTCLVQMSFFPNILELQLFEFTDVEFMNTEGGCIYLFHSLKKEVTLNGCFVP